MTKTLRDALLTIGEEEMLFRQSVHFSVSKGGLFYDDLKERIYAMYDTVRDIPSCEGDTKDVILSYFAYSDNMATFFADLFGKEPLVQEFREIPEWDKINLDLMPESVPEGQTNFFDLSDEAYISLAASALKMRPLPVKWTNDQFDRVLRASVSDKDVDTGADAITSRFLFSGFRIGYYSHSSLKLEGLTIPKREDYPREDVFHEYWAEFRGDLYSWISCYQEMKKYVEGTCEQCHLKT